MGAGRTSTAVSDRPPRSVAARLRGADVAVKTPELQVSHVHWAGIADVEPQALGLTYWFDAPNSGDPAAVTIRFVGKRIGAGPKAGAQDRFDVVETIDKVIPGTGPIAVTTRVRGIMPGRWQVTAAPDKVTSRGPSKYPAARTARRGSASAVGTTAFSPVISVLAPGARIGAWSGLVAVGTAVALISQWFLATRTGLPASRVLLVALIACVVGVAGAKLYYVVGHLIKGDLARGLDMLTGGMCIQGFVLGAVTVLLAGAAVTGVSVGALLDITTPGLMFGMTVGRFGCFFGGCCAGRPTAARWGLWSSDRRVGMRRVPTQLFEAAVALAIGVTALLAVGVGPPRPSGVVFVGAMAAYTLGRQLLFPLRAGARHTTYGRVLTIVVTGLVLAAALVVAATAG